MLIYATFEIGLNCQNHVYRNTSKLISEGWISVEKNIGGTNVTEKIVPPCTNYVPRNEVENPAKYKLGEGTCYHYIDEDHLYREANKEAADIARGDFNTVATLTHDRSLKETKKNVKTSERLEAKTDAKGKKNYFESEGSGESVEY